MGIALAYTFTSVLYADSFYRYRAFYSERTRAQLWHYSYTSFFHTTLALPNLRALRMRTKNTFLPFQLATLVCSPARCGYLTPYLIAPKRTGEFLIFQASKIGFPQKGLFVSRSRRSLLFCFLILFFTIYFFIRFSPYLFAVCLAFEYMTIIKPFFRTAKLFEKKNLERSKNSLFANMERTRAK